MAESDSEKTEEPTQQRREDFRKRGQVAQTKELGSVLVIFTGLFTVFLLGRFFLIQFNEIFEVAIGNMVHRAPHEGIIPAVRFAAEKTVLLVSPVLGIFWVTSLISSVIQVGFLNNEDALSFNLDKINPLEGFKRIFSLRSVIEGLKAVMKVAVVCIITYYVFKGEIFSIPKLVEFSVGQIFNFLGRVTFKLFGSIGIFMGSLAAFDYFFQRWDLEQKMRMTKQEVKEEMKSREGDPLIKARIRRVQREMSQKRMMEDVPTADVVVTNPTHIAVALQYTNAMIAPTIVAMGAGVIAERIKEIARDNRIPIVENKPLARTIFKTLDVGQAIPRELYTAVAEVLSYIYKLKKKRMV